MTTNSQKTAKQQRQAQSMENLEALLEGTSTYYQLGFLLAFLSRVASENPWVRDEIQARLVQKDLQRPKPNGH